MRVQKTQITFFSRHVYACISFMRVKKKAELYVYEDDGTKQIDGFIGLSNEHIEGIFVREDVQ